MLGIKGKLLIAVLFVAAVLFTGETRLRLDGITESFRNSFREMLYLPRGDALKILACGFDSPLADALFIKGMVFYAESLDASDEAKAASRNYSYALFDVITDLSPRFHRAYQVGGNLLAGSGDLETNLNSVRLLEKGVAFWDGLEKKGEHVRTDPRWLFHVMQGVSFNLGIPSKLLKAGDADGAAEARSRAVEEFVLAARSPDAPSTVRLAAAGILGSSKGIGGIEESTRAMHGVLAELYEAAEAGGDREIAEDLSRQLESNAKFLAKIQETRAAETVFSEAGREFAARAGRPPEGLAELVAAGILRALPESFPLDGEEESDAFLPLPDGSFRSRRLADLETGQYTSVLTNSAQAYRRAHGTPPADLNALVESKFLDRIPPLPLEALGQRYEYDAERGRATSVMPSGPDLPPDRR